MPKCAKCEYPINRSDNYEVLDWVHIYHKSCYEKLQAALSQSAEEVALKAKK